MLPVKAEQAYDLIGKCLPTVPAMAESLVLPYGQTGVEEEHTLSGPAAQIAAYRDGRARLGLYLLKDIAERRRKLHTVIHTEAESVSLARPMIRVLPQDDNLDLTEWGAVESIEYEMPRGIATAGGVLRMNKADEFAKVRFGKLVAQYCFPGWFDSHIRHDRLSL